MAKKFVYEVYVDLSVGDDFTVASVDERVDSVGNKIGKADAYQIAKNAIENGVTKEDFVNGEFKSSIFYSPNDIIKVTVARREVDVLDPQ